MDLMNESVRIFCNNIIARAEAVLAQVDEKITHEPTIAFYKGQKSVAEQILAELGEVSSLPIKATIKGGKIILRNNEEIL